MDNNKDPNKNNRNSGRNLQQQASRQKRRKKKKQQIVAVLLQLGMLTIIVGVLIYFLVGNPLKIGSDNNTNNPGNIIGGNNTDNTVNSDESTEDESVDLEAEKLKEMEVEVEKAIEESNVLALSYYYDEAIAKLDEFEAKYKAQYGPNQDIQEAKAQLEIKISELTPFGAYSQVEEAHHVFFHSLIADTSKAFDGDYKENGYNYYMTTVSEFIEMMKQMYEDGYVLVSMHDLVEPVQQDDGSIVMKTGDLLLPPDKKPFILSVDDVNYYEYMIGDGFADKIIIDENGRPSNEMTLDDGSKVVGDFDVVPVLETFLEEYPDFSYQGARGILALTGYEGAFGYRTNDTASPTYEKDKATVVEVAKALREWGWDFASHSWGHRDMNKYGYDFLVGDTNRWLDEVGSIVGPTDIYIFPYGIDIEDAGPYDSAKYQYLREKGFLYYCGVYKSPWMQTTDDYVRMTRRPLDGQAMLQFPERLADLFDLEKVIDPARPPLR